MINKIKAFIKTILIIISALIFCIMILFFFESSIGNGLFAEWFHNNFISEYYAPAQDSAPVLHQEFVWGNLKQFLIIAFIGSTVFLVGLIMLIAYLHGRKRARDSINTISKAMNDYLAEGGSKLSLPKEYMGVENQLIQMKATQQRHEQIIKEETQQKNDLITYLAHDLKTPLASVIGYLCLLDEAYDLPSQLKTKYIGVALEKSYRLETLINEFFEITRFNLHSIVVNRRKINLSHMMQQLADEFYPLIGPQNKRIAIHIPIDLVLWGDADKLARVFNNILKNAVAYSYADSTIDIFATKRQQDAVITFQNQGDPIPAQKLDTIFDKFYRLDSARSTNTGGAGLGLAIAQEIVTAHHGTITAESTEKSTVFTVSLPQSSNQAG